MNFVLFYQTLSKYFHFLFNSKTKDKDLFRKGFILNVLLIGSILLSFSAFVSASIGQIIDGRFNGSYDGIHPFILLMLSFFYFVLYLVSRSGKIIFSSYILLVLYFCGATYTAYFWGVDVPQAILIYALIIVMSGILIGSRFAVLMSTIVAGVLITLGYFQQEGLIVVTSSWKTQPAGLRDSFITIVTLFVISIVSWLSNREIEKSLKRARASEAELKKERDLLEIKVEERTRDLKQAQLEKMTQLYRFAEVGRLSSSLFHDLVTPLSLISLNLERLKYKKEQGSIENMQAQLKKAIKATKYLETFVIAVRRQLQNQGSKKLFSLNKEIKLVMQMVRHKAQNLQVKISLKAVKDIKMYGDQIKFSQLMVNLVLNAIDAYEDIDINKKNREVEINLSLNNNSILLSICDKGVGIIPANLSKIFQPFFTTKNFEKGTGIGLSISQEIVEKNFGGKIYVRSNKSEGTIFTVAFPLKKNIKEKNESTALIASSK